jgi:4-carboxymuconolactone decarboxylase
MDIEEFRQRGMALRRRIFGDAAVASRMQAQGEFGAPLQDLINGVAYGDIWSRPGLDAKLRSLVVIGINAALDRPQELRIHIQGALANGCTVEEIREILLMIAIYCGIPAANEAHRIAFDLLREKGLV